MTFDFGCFDCGCGGLIYNSFTVLEGGLCVCVCVCVCVCEREREREREREGVNADNRHTITDLLIQQVV